MVPEEDTRNMLTTAEAAKELGYCDRWVRELAKQGKLVGQQRPGGKWFFSRRELDRLLSRGTGPLSAGSPSSEPAGIENSNQQNLKALVSENIGLAGRAIEAYLDDLDHRVRFKEFIVGLSAASMLPKDTYNAEEKAFISQVRGLEPQLMALEVKFATSLEEKDIDSAKYLLAQVKEQLSTWTGISL